MGENELIGVVRWLEVIWAEKLGLTHSVRSHNVFSLSSVVKINWAFVDYLAESVDIYTLLVNLV